MAKVLTTAAVEKLTAGKARREVPDGGAIGLRLVIQPSGFKSWAMRFRRPGSGRQTKVTLGPLALVDTKSNVDPVIGQPLTLVQARKLAAGINHERASGHDVSAQQHRVKLERQARGKATFDVAARDYIVQYVQRERRRWIELARTLGYDDKVEIIRKGLADRWRDRGISKISADDVFSIIDESRERGLPGLAVKVKGPNNSRALVMHSALSGMFGWLRDKRRVDKNPVEDVAKPGNWTPRDRVLKSAEVIKFWRASEQEPAYKELLQLLLLTGCRRNEVAGMRREEVDGLKWTIPGSRTKNKLPHEVWLPKNIKLPDSPFDLVFTSTGKTPISGWSKMKVRLDKRMGVSNWRLHDLRRTCATEMAELGIQPHIVEAVLNHTSGAKAKVAGTYNRAAYSAEKKAAWERWANHVAGLVSGRAAKIVPMKRRG